MTTTRHSCRARSCTSRSARPPRRGGSAPRAALLARARARSAPFSRARPRFVRRVFRDCAIPDPDAGLCCSPGSARLTAAARPGGRCAIADAVSVLERGGGSGDPVSAEIEGTWRLLYVQVAFDARLRSAARGRREAGLEGLFAGLFGDEAAKEFAVNADPVAIGVFSPIQRGVAGRGGSNPQAIRLFDLGEARGPGGDVEADNAWTRWCSSGTGITGLSAKPAFREREQKQNRVHVRPGVLRAGDGPVRRRAAFRAAGARAVPGAFRAARGRGEGVAGHVVPREGRAHLEGEQRHDVRAGQRSRGGERGRAAAV